MGYFEFKNNETALNEINLMAMQKAIAELLLPIGSPYITQEDVNPSTILGFGTWERSKGKVFVGLDENDADFNAIGKTGGEKTHTLTIEEMPRHSHAGLYWYNYGIGLDSGEGANLMETNSGGNSNTVGRLTTGEVGGSQPFDITQPYEVVGYMWIRRA